MRWDAYGLLKKYVRCQTSILTHFPHRLPFIPTAAIYISKRKDKDQASTTSSTATKLMTGTICRDLSTRKKEEKFLRYLLVASQKSRLIIHGLFSGNSIYKT
jgi:hypothetical protein